MELENVTIQDCIDMYVMKGKATIINNGEVEGFASEKISPADR